MHIKAVHIEGFKTYKELTTIEGFDKGQNIILGKNGSGKSNVFDAIQFVLSDKYSNLRHDERQRLLHEGSGRDIMTASVELIFDNTDMRFPVDRTEVSLKRTIGLKKDEYFLDNKHVSKSEVVSLLESAGLSRSNPYYIVQQGQVRRLIKMKDSERLELLKEIAGTRTYDERRKESKKIMAETDKRRAQIDEVIVYIEKRLTELEEEKSELKRYQDLDSQRRCLEYTVYDHELKDAVSKLEKIEGSRENNSERTAELHNSIAAAKKSIAECEESIKVLQDDLAKAKAKRSQLEEARRTAIKKRAKVELNVKDAQDKVNKDKEKKKGATAEAKQLKEEISKSKAELVKAQTEYKEKIQIEEKLKEEIRHLEQRLAGLYDKQGRKNQFSSKHDRDKFLKTQIKDITKNLESERKQLQKIEGENERLRKKIGETTGALENEAKAMEENKQALEDCNGAYDKLKQQRNDATNARKELWRKENALSGGLRSYQHNLEKWESRLQSTMDKTLFKGLKAVEQIVASKKIKGVHGTVVSLFDCEEKFQKCVETTAGNSLFHVVVDDDEIASTIIKELNKMGAGRVTFVPLNRISTKEHTYPKSVDVIPMIDKLHFEPQFRKAMLQIFSKTLIARDLDTAAKFSQTHNFNTITLSGDQVNKRGALTGGYVDHKVSRLQTMSEIKKAKQLYEEKQEEAATLKKDLEEKDVLVTKSLAEIEKLTEKRSHLRNEYQQHQLEHRSLKKTLSLEQDELSRNEKVAHELKLRLSHLEDKVSALNDELKSDFAQQLSAEDQNELKQTQENLTQLKKNLMEASEARSKIETEKKVIENLLETNLLKRQDEVESMINSQDTEGINELLEKHSHELSVVTDEIGELESQMDADEQQLSTGSKKLDTLQNDLEKYRTKLTESQRILHRESKSFEQLLAKRSQLMTKKDDCNRKIRDLGSLPQEALADKYKKLSQTQLMKKLESVNNKIKGYSHVNKKAMDQYMNFTDQREDLMTRKKELDKGRKAILNLIDHLDQKKDEAIERTFKGIAKHFSTVFSELVPNGKGTLVIKTSKKKGDDAESDGEESEEENMEPNATRHYSGVSIKVSFTGSRVGDQSMYQLSGGQQSVVALSLIFAIQRCDPSPFYLFDEIDSNLDAVHRTSVARMITSQAKTTQFICTTFRPEMLQRAAKFYGVSFSSKVSQVNEISRDEAKELILVVEQEMEAAKR